MNIVDINPKIILTEWNVHTVDQKFNNHVLNVLNIILLLIKLDKYGLYITLTNILSNHK